MQERARLLGGSVCFDGNTGLDGGKGFAVHAEIPIRWGK
jgi:signal transduction histidine kinase